MSRRIMTGCGAVFLVALMLVCAFSLGVFAAERGITQMINARAAQGTPPPLRVPAVGTPNVMGIGTALRRQHADTHDRGGSAHDCRRRAHNCPP